MRESRVKAKLSFIVAPKRAARVRSHSRLKINYYRTTRSAFHSIGNSNNISQVIREPSGAPLAPPLGGRRTTGPLLSRWFCLQQSRNCPGAHQSNIGDAPRNRQHAFHERSPSQEILGFGDCSAPLVRKAA